MTIREQINTDMKEAMRNRESLRLEVIRAIKTAFTNELVATGGTPQDLINDDQAVTVIKRLHKQRHEASAQFIEAGRQDLADKEIAESEILQSYLPAQLSDDELLEIVKTIKADSGIDDPAKSGILVGAVMKQVGAAADGRRVKLAIDTLFAKA